MFKEEKSKHITNYISEKSNKLIYTVDRKQKTILYKVFSTKGKTPYDQIYFDGFEKLPTGFYTEGYGLTTGAWLINKFLEKKYGDEIRLHISAKGKTSVRKTRNSIEVVFNYKQLKQLQDRLRQIKTDKNRESENAAEYYFSKFFPEDFDEPTEVEGNVYSSGSLAGILTSDGIVENLSTADVKALDEFYPEFYSQSNSTLSADKKLYKITQDKNEAEVIYLENIIQVFEKKLGQNLPEPSWQNFLREYILLFNTNYSDFIEKANINIAVGKFPDFMLIDVYNYLDIYEIKKPTTNLLKEDKSRNNYYWDVEIAKAISQVENYTHTINKNSSAFREEIKRTRGIDIRVVKPRGIIIAGSSKQFKKNEVIEDNFRLLNRSLKNVEIILYDELLANLRMFLKRLKSEKINTNDGSS